ncbi:hypothetical protein M0804_015631 [Polistes exclamans]|nr:hypothetical protein M0804_015633 [Polistes exclamans]KAI4472735.1 hypothetical protein M0804_015631 [Polistes exclamans]
MPGYGCVKSGKMLEDCRICVGVCIMYL